MHDSLKRWLYYYCTPYIFMMLVQFFCNLCCVCVWMSWRFEGECACLTLLSVSAFSWATVNRPKICSNNKYFPTALLLEFLSIIRIFYFLSLSLSLSIWSAIRQWLRCWRYSHSDLNFLFEMIYVSHNQRDT